MPNSDQTPEYSDIRKYGYDGGDFLFIRQCSEQQLYLKNEQQACYAKWIGSMCTMGTQYIVPQNLYFETLNIYKNTRIISKDFM